MTDQSAHLEEIRRVVAESNIIDFEAAGQLVSKLGPQLGRLGAGGGSPVADDYVVKGIDSVIHVYKLRDFSGGFGGDPAALSEVGARLSELGQQLRSR